MSSCIIFGGAGYIGTHLAQHFLQTGRFTQVHLADIKDSPLKGQPGITASNIDVRQPIPTDIAGPKAEWIFNLAAIHREPGHWPHEYFETNLLGAKNVADYAERTNCSNIFFTSSIAVYGPTSAATDESSLTCPTTAYGSSKYAAELIFERWAAGDKARRLLTVRPGVIYGPGDPGNILRMIRAVKAGYFAFPGRRDQYKSYGYIHGLIDSIEFTMSQQGSITYNYVESPTETLGQIVDHARRFVGARARSVALPLWLLLPIAHVAQLVFGKSNPVHPVRVKKVATSTHIVPARLRELGFEFRYPFLRSLEHWQELAPEDFH
jgi:nucleoside-diphosphate-sugar epimerase